METQKCKCESCFVEQEMEWFVIVWRCPSCGHSNDIEREDNHERGTPGFTVGNFPTVRKNPFGAKRNHERGHGWKANHQT